MSSKKGEAIFCLFLICSIVSPGFISLCSFGVKSYGVGPLTAVFGGEVSRNADAMWVEPGETSFANVNIGFRFNMTIWLNMTENVFVYQVALHYNRTQLKCLRVFPTAPPTSEYMASAPGGTTFAKNIDRSFLGNGSVLAAETCYPDVISGPHCDSLMWLEFEVIAEPSFMGNFDLTTETTNPPGSGNNWVGGLSNGGDVIYYPIVAYDGCYEFLRPPLAHDVAVTGVRLSKNVAVQGETVNVQVDVVNYWNMSEYSNVTLYADAYQGTIGDETVIGNQTTNLQGGSLEKLSSMTLAFSWDTTGVEPGNLTVSAEVEAVGDINATNDLLSDGMIQILAVVHDVAVTDIRPSQKAVYAGDPVNVEVDAQNLGNLIEAANVTLYADNDTAGDVVVVGTQRVTMEKFSLTTATFSWDTLGLAAGNYTLRAAAFRVPGEVNLENNNKTDGVVRVFQILPCPDVNVTCPAALTVNPSIFTFDPNLHARLINIGNVSILSTGFEGDLRVVGSENGTVRLCVNQAGVDAYPFYLAQYCEVQVPLWLVFQPEDHWGTYSGTYTLNLTVCGTHRAQLMITGIDIRVCQNGVYIVNNNTATFTWNLTGGSLVYLEAEPDLPPGWTYTVDPPIGTFFETPHVVAVNITASPDAGEGDIGRVTLRAYKNSTGAMIWQFIYFATTGNKPPTVESVETPTLTPDGHLLFNATVTDASGIAEARLHYSVDGGQWENTTLHWASGDTFNSTVYTLDEAFSTPPHTLQYFVSAVNWLGNETATATQTVSIANDVAVTGMNVTSINESGGYTVSLDAAIANCGTLPLSYVNVAVYANSTLVATAPALFVENGASTTVPFALNLSEGKYIITAVATPSAYETNTANNAMHLPKVLRLLHDVEAINITLSKNVVCQGFSMQANATVANQGGFDESFNVALEANGTTITNQTITLASEGMATLVFDWNTSEVEVGSYAMSVYAWPVLRETETADNNFTGGWIKVVIVGDVTTDGKVDGKDLGWVAWCFGSYPDAPPPMTWDPNCDINNDGKVDGKDLGIVGWYFGTYDP